MLSVVYFGCLLSAFSLIQVHIIKFITYFPILFIFLLGEHTSFDYSFLIFFLLRKLPSIKEVSFYSINSALLKYNNLSRRCSIKAEFCSFVTHYQYDTFN